MQILQRERAVEEQTGIATVRPRRRAGRRVVKLRRSLVRDVVSDLLLLPATKGRARRAEVHPPHVEHVPLEHFGRSADLDTALADGGHYRASHLEHALWVTILGTHIEVTGSV